MFNESFYPTPIDVALRLIKPLIEEVEIQGNVYCKLPSHNLLEPSAGKGDLLDVLQTQLGWKHVQSGELHKFTMGDKGFHKKWHAIEIEPELQAILRDKEYTIVDSDFLAYHPDKKYDIIVMNPPFRNGADHLLHAWECLEDGGQLACILNAQTILNPHTSQRQGIISLIERYGRYEVWENAFRNAERTTDVDVALIWLNKPESSYQGYEFIGLEWDAGVKQQDEYAGQDLASADGVKALVEQYRVCEQLLRDKHDVFVKLQYYMKPIRSDHENKDADSKIKTSLIEEIVNLKARFWRFVFEATGVGKQATSKYQQDFTKQMEAQQRMAFNERNIYTVLEGFMLNRNAIMQDSIARVFDSLTRYHQNRIEGEGWKSNKAYRLNHKIVIPYGISYQYNMWLLNYGQIRELYGDLDKVLCYITGKPYDDITTVADALDAHMEEMRKHRSAYDDKFYSEFFELRIFKKGTVHLKFIDKKICDDFNLAVAKGKNWVGAGY